MDFIDELRTRAGRFAKRAELLRDKEVTEESTKTSFVLPFIQMLGYDIFNPAEVIPEFTADIGTKKSEKVDYALLQDGVPRKVKIFSRSTSLYCAQVVTVTANRSQALVEPQCFPPCV